MLQNKKSLKKDIKAPLVEGGEEKKNDNEQINTAATRTALNDSGDDDKLDDEANGGDANGGDANGERIIQHRSNIDFDDHIVDTKEMIKLQQNHIK